MFRHEVDACADAASALAAEHGPGEALTLWLHRFTDFLATKRGLVAALHSGDSAYDALPAYFDQRFRPALTALLESAAEAGEVRADVEPNDLLHAVANLCQPAGPSDDDPSGHIQRMLALLIDGLRYRAAAPATNPHAGSDDD